MYTCLGPEYTEDEELNFPRAVSEALGYRVSEVSLRGGGGGGGCEWRNERRRAGCVAYNMRIGFSGDGVCSGLFLFAAVLAVAWSFSF